jgi:predicted RNase H-like nuclease (RuvC/YqgF family)
MITLCKKLCKTTLIGTAVLGTLAGGALLVAGPTRTQAVLHDVKTRVSQAIDAQLDDPIALRNELGELEKEYPRRIAKVRRDLGGLQQDIRQLEREASISRRVVELADDDLAALRPAVKQASAGQVSGGSRARLAAVVVDSRVYTLRSADAKLRQIENTRRAHASRAADAGHQIAFLRQQESQFAGVLNQLEAEQAQFSAQLEQLNRQVDSIQRNERLIDLLDKRKRTLEECTAYDVASLDQLTGKLQQILTQQSAELDVLTAAEDAATYEDLAREQLDRETDLQDVVDRPESGIK